ncbi:unnamed protein product, partial [Meganyctiphanes norvegica]
YIPFQEEAWCTCVPWYLCNTDNNTIITDGTGIIDIRASTSNVEVCPVNDGAKKEICCGSRPTPSSPSVRPSLTGVNPPTVWCECIPERLCNNGVINTDGAGILDPRIGNRNITVNVKFCPATVGEAEICCGLPPSELTTTEQNTTEQTTTQHTTTEQTTLSPVSSTVKITEEVTHPSKVTYGHILSTPGSHTGMENAASYISSFFLLLILLLITHFFVI